MNIDTIPKVLNLISQVIEMPDKMQLLQAKAKWFSKIKLYASCLKGITEDPNLNIDRDILRDFCNHLAGIIEETKSIFEKCIGESFFILILKYQKYENSIAEFSKQLDDIPALFEFIKQFRIQTAKVNRVKPSVVDTNTEKFLKIKDKKKIVDQESLLKALYDSHLISETELNQLRESFNLTSAHTEVKRNKCVVCCLSILCCGNKSDPPSPIQQKEKNSETGLVSLEKPLSEDELLINLKEIASTYDSLQLSISPGK